MMFNRQYLFYIIEFIDLFIIDRSLSIFMKNYSYFSTIDKPEHLTWKIPNKLVILYLSKLLHSILYQNNLPFFQIKIIPFYRIAVLHHLSFLIHDSLILKIVNSIDKKVLILYLLIMIIIYSLCHSGSIA